MLKILIADDSLLIRQLLKPTLVKICSCEIDDAEDGQQALQMMELNTYDLILLDWNMPKLSGEEALRAVRAGLGPNKESSVIMVTAEADREHVLKLATLGISGYIVKPFTSVVLEEKIRHVLKSRIQLG